MKQQSFSSFSVILLFLCFTKTFSQSPAAAPSQQAMAPVRAPPPPPPPTMQPKIPVLPGTIDVAKILERAGNYKIFVRLLKETDSASELIVELNHTHNGITIFAPTDSAFAGLKVGTLNDLTDNDKVKLVKFHILPIYISNSQFQTVSNPLKTQAGKGGRVSLNVTTTGNIVNITTGVVNTTVSGIVYNDTQLAIYQVDQVLLPMDLFTPNKLPPTAAPAPLVVVAPPPEKPKNVTTPVVDAPSVPMDDVSGGVIFGVYYINVVILVVSIMMFSL